MPFDLNRDIVWTVLIALVSFGGSWIGLLIKSKLGGIELALANNKAALLAEQQKVKSELLRSQSEAQEESQEKHLELLRGQHELQTDFSAKHAENKQEIAVHIGEDKQQFAAISRTLQRIDGNLETIVQRSGRGERRVT